MTRSDVTELLERHQAAFRALDAVRLAADHAPTGMFITPAHGTVRGRAAIEEIYRYWFNAFPDLEFSWEEPVIDGDRAAFFWSFAGTQRGQFFSFECSNKRLEMNGAAHYAFEDGLISIARHVFDFSGALLKIGALKTRHL